MPRRPDEIRRGGVFIAFISRFYRILRFDLIDSESDLYYNIFIDYENVYA